MVFKLFQLNMPENKGKILLQLILSTNQQNNHKLSHFVILQMIFQEPTLTCIQSKIFKKSPMAVTNVITVINFS